MRIATLLSICVIIGLAGCSIIHTVDKVKGSGIAKTEKRSPGSFNSLDVSFPGSIQVRSQEHQGLEISGDDNIVPLITAELKNDTLYIRTSKDCDPKSKLEIIVTAPDLKKFTFAGAGEADLSNIKNDHLEIAMSGAGSLRASGETKAADISLTGVGSVDAKDLHAVDVKVKSTGVGSVDLYATGSLDAKASGIGEINYYGNPKVVSKQNSGIGSINEK